MTVPQELRTARLLLRSFERGDVPLIVRLAGAREIAATTINIPYPYTEDDARRFLAHASEDSRTGRAVHFAITAPPSRNLCGAIGLTLAPPHRRAELGYWIGKPFWGRGWATEAATAVVSFGFRVLGLNRIHASHYSGNLASQRVLEKIGMRYEGQSRQHYLKWDRLIDVENYGVLAAEFRAAE